MNSLRSSWLLPWAALAAFLLPGQLAAIGFDEVLDYDEAYRISATAPARDLVEIRWDIEQDYYLYNNKFLKFTAQTPGVVLGEPIIPPGKKQFDELLGEEVIKFHDRLGISLPLDSVPANATSLALEVQSQGCLEAVLCYPPTRQFVTVQLPPAAAPGAASLSAAFDAAPGGDPLARDEALAPDDAFVYEAIGLSAETVLVRFTIQPGYYLYVDKFAFRVTEGEGFGVRSVDLPAGVIKDDPEFGPVPVYYDQVEIPVRLNRPAGPEQMITLEADYQGCRDGEICYPPQSSQLSFLMAASGVAINEPVTAAEPEPAPAVLVGVPLSEQDRLARLLLDNPAAALFAFFVAGLLLAFTPCVFPMVPILSGIIAGQGQRLTTARAFWLSLVYVLAMAATYTIAGVLAGLFGKNLQAAFQNPWIIGGFVAVFVALALSMFGFYELQLPSRWQSAMARRSNREGGGRFGGVAVMGFLSALIVGPCVAPPLAAALIVIGASGDPVLGGTALFALSMGMGVPLIAFGVSAGRLIPRAGAWMDAVKAVFGVGLLALGVWMLERIVPGPVILFLWGLLAIGSGVFMGALQSLPADASGWRKLWKALGLALLVIGAAELAGAAAGNSNWLKPLAGLGTGAPQAEHVAFRRIKSLADLETAVAQANAANKPAMLDFYADWCVECIRMERNTFPEPEVQALLAQVQPLQADVTPNDEVDQALMQKFGIIGPPAILFFDRQGNEMPAYRLVGYFKPDEFAAHLQRVIDAP
ncbi:MAG TPA: protein-disulfide reductase DsbD [Xanthomonadales bacterium]|nr:protein-disulfide reductase DsbD [Xanthomonadales bacterium]